MLNQVKKSPLQVKSVHLQNPEMHGDSLVGVDAATGEKTVVKRGSNNKSGFQGALDKMHEMKSNELMVFDAQVIGDNTVAANWVEVPAVDNQLFKSKVDTGLGRLIRGETSVIMEKPHCIGAKAEDAAEFIEKFESRDFVTLQSYDDIVEVAKKMFSESQAFVLRYRQDEDNATLAIRGFPRFDDNGGGDYQPNVARSLDAIEKLADWDRIKRILKHEKWDEYCSQSGAHVDLIKLEQTAVANPGSKIMFNLDEFNKSPEAASHSGWTDLCRIAGINGEQLNEAINRSSNNSSHLSIIKGGLSIEQAKQIDELNVPGVSTRKADYTRQLTNQYGLRDKRTGFFAAEKDERTEGYKPVYTAMTGIKLQGERGDFFAKIGLVDSYANMKTLNDLPLFDTIKNEKVFSVKSDIVRMKERDGGYKVPELEQVNVAKTTAVEQSVEVNINTESKPAESTTSTSVKSASAEKEGATSPKVVEVNVTEEETPPAEEQKSAQDKMQEHEEQPVDMADFGDDAGLEDMSIDDLMNEIENEANSGMTPAV